MTVNTLQNEHTLQVS